MLKKTSELSYCSVSSACSTLRMQKCSSTAAIMRNCVYFFSPFMSPSISHNSPRHSADLWWCFPPSCLYPVLLFPGLAPSVPWRGKVKLLNHLLCPFPSPLAILAPHGEAAEMWPCLLFGLRFFLPPWSNTQSFDHVLGNCCSSASPLVSSALLPSHHLSFFIIDLLVFCSLLSVVVPWTFCLFWLLQALLCSVGSHPSLYSSSSRPSMTVQTSSVKNCLFQAIWLPGYAGS